MRGVVNEGFYCNSFPIFATKILNPFAMSFLVVNLLPSISKHSG